jgi:hypothetical protein
LLKKISILILALLGICGGFCRPAFCEIRADALLQEDILSNLVVVDPATKETMQPRIVSQKVLKVENDPATGQWREILEEWVLAWGEKERTFIIKLTPSAQVGVEYSIIPKQIAERTGLLEGIPQDPASPISPKSSR